MAFIPTPDAVKVCMRYNNSGQLACNVFHVKVTDPITPVLLNGIGAIAANWWNSNLKALTAPQTALDAVEVTDVSVAGGAGIEYSTGLPSNGTSSSNIAPQNVTIATKLTSGLTGRSQRGRSFLVGTPQAAATLAGMVEPSFRAALDAAFEVLINNYAASGWPLAVKSLYHLGAPRVAGVLTEILAASVNAAIDSQRRRLPERGA